MAEKIVALAGNPNVGKSTVFNALTGMKQHTGNWVGKTVSNAFGDYKFNNIDYTLVDLPGTYSLLVSSEEEARARDFLLSNDIDAVIVVVDATCLERNLNLVLQIMEITDSVVVCVNLLDEAKKKKIIVDVDELSLYLGVPVVGTCASKGRGLNELKEAVEGVVTHSRKYFPTKIEYNEKIEDYIDEISTKIDGDFTEKIKRYYSLRIIENDKYVGKLDFLGTFSSNIYIKVINDVVFDELEKIKNKNRIKRIKTKTIIKNRKKIKINKINHHKKNSNNHNHNQMTIKCQKKMLSNF